MYHKQMGDAVAAAFEALESACKMDIFIERKNKDVI